MTRPTGYIPDEPDGRDLMLSAHPGLLAAPVSFAVAERRDQIYPAKRQRRRGTCVGQAGGGGLRLAYEDATGQPCPELSGLAANRFAQTQGGRAPGVRDGAQIRNLIRAVRQIGIPPESEWPYSEEKDLIDSEVPADAIASGFDQRLFRGYYRISPDDLDGVRKSLANRAPVIAGWTVGIDFTSSDGREIFTHRGGGDGHAMVIVAHGSPAALRDYYGDAIPETDEPELFRLLNSWGDDWGYRGRCYVTPSWLKWWSDGWSLDVRK